MYFKYYFYFIAHSQKESATAELLLGSIGSTRWPYLNIWCVPVEELTIHVYLSVISAYWPWQLKIRHEFCGLL